MTRFWSLCQLLLCLASGPLDAGELYSTDFEGFPVGDNLWAGTESWVSNDTTSGAQGILQDYVTNLDLGKTAYLGFETPAGPFTTVARPVNYDPAVGGFPRIEFESFLGVQDSNNGLRDRFFVSFYNIGGTFLAAIVFDNTSANGDVLRWQGLANDAPQVSNTGVPFVRGDQSFGFVALQILRAQIDLVNNTWSAQLDGIPLFSDAPFTDEALAPLTLGSVAAEWELSIPQPAFAGNNWLLVADWFVRSVPVGVEPFVIDGLTRDEAGETTLSWLGEPGFDYQVWYSDDLESWHDTLPDASFPGITLAAPLSFTDRETLPKQRYYRVVRTATP